MDWKRCGDVAGPQMKRVTLEDGSEVILPADAVVRPRYKEGDPFDFDTPLGGTYD